MTKIYFFIISILSLTNGQAETKKMNPAVLEQNKRIVREFYNLAFNQHKPLVAAEKYLADDYIQHNPHVATGKKGFMEAFADIPKTFVESKANFKRFIAENDLVVLHSHKTKSSTDRGVAGIDIFRVTNGKITEHWDINQPIPETSKNSNTMF